MVSKTDWTRKVKTTGPRQCCGRLLAFGASLAILAWTALPGAAHGQDSFGSIGAPEHHRSLGYLVVTRPQFSCTDYYDIIFLPSGGGGFTARDPEGNNTGQCNVTTYFDGFLYQAPGGVVTWIGRHVDRLTNTAIDRNAGKTFIPGPDPFARVRSLIRNARPIDRRFNFRSRAAVLGVRGFAPGTVELERFPVPGETYRWSRDGTEFLEDGSAPTGATYSGTHSANMTISGMSEADEGLYVLHATRDGNETMVDSITVYFDRDLPDLITSPEDREACIGGSTTFHAAVSGSNVSYSWLRDGQRIENGLSGDGAFVASGTETAVLTLTDLMPNAAGSYMCSFGSGTYRNSTQETMLTFSDNAVAPEIVEHPTPASTCVGQAAELTCDASSTNSGGPESAVSFQWRKDGVPIFDTPRIEGTSTTRLIINSAQAADAGMYDCVVSRACASAVTAAAPLTILSPCCVADTDDGSGTGLRDGGVTIDDLLYYLFSFEAGDIRSDVDDGSGTGTLDGGVTIDDLLYFLQRFEAGC